MNTHHPPEEGDFCDEYGNTLKQAIVVDTFVWFWCFMDQQRTNKIMALREL